jgi:type I restriction enzyme S subunit
MKTLVKVKLGDLTEIARGSSPRPISNQAYFDGGSIPWVKIADATASVKYVYQTKLHVNDYGASFSRKLPSGSLIVSASGVSLGFAIFLGVEGCVHDGWIYFKYIDSSKLDKDYLYFLLNTFTKSFHSMSYGAAIQNINTSILRETEIPLPDLITQKKIAAILSAYDDLIENNKRRIDLLENTAEEIYREWFVRFRFPGYQTAEFEKGVPKKWSLDRIDSLGKVATGKTPSTTNTKYYGGRIPFIKTPDMHGNVFVYETEEFLTEDGLNSQPSQILEKNAICVSCIGTGGVVSMTTKKCSTNQQINSLTLKTESDREWAFFTLKALKPTILAFGATGATMTNLSKGKFAGIKAIIPNNDLRLRFNRVVNPMFEKIQFLSMINENLVNTKNQLLTRLISGKLSVENLDIQFPPSMREASTNPEMEVS